MAEFDEALIALVKDYPCLYNTKVADFKINLKKENAWKDIAMKLKSNVDVVIKRWKNLRERYTKEHKKRNKPTGTGTDETDKLWEFYLLMDFLSDFVRHRSTVTNIPSLTSTDSDKLDELDDSASSDSNTIISADFSSSGSSSEAKELMTPPSTDIKPLHTKKPQAKGKRRKLDPDPIELEILSQLQKSSAEDTTVVDEDFAFSKVIALTLKKFDAKQKARTKIKIQQLLYEMEFEEAASVSVQQQNQVGFPPVVDHDRQRVGFNGSTRNPINDSFSSPSPDYPGPNPHYFPNYAEIGK